MIDLAAISDGLIRDTAGRWVPTDASGEAISYPSDGANLCFGVEDASFWFAHRNDVIAETVNRFPPKGAIFDIGGGNGFVAKGLAERGFEVVLVEPSRDATAHAVSRALTNVVCGTVADARFHPGTLGAAGLFDVIEHIEDDVGFLRGLRPLLMADAPLYFTVPAFETLWSVDDDEAGHFRRYRRRTLAATLDAAGFDLIYATYIFAFLLPGIALLRSLPSRLGLRRPLDEQSIAKEHDVPRWSRALVAPFLSTERRLIRRGFELPFGASILAVARERRGAEGILEG